MTCQPKFLLQPLSEKTTWPFFFPLDLSVGVQLEECNYSFFTRLEGTVYFLGVETNLT